MKPFPSIVTDYQQWVDALRNLSLINYDYCWRYVIYYVRYSQALTHGASRDEAALVAQRAMHDGRRE